MRPPRGTTMRIEHRADEGRTLPYGVFWNEYKPGHTGRPKQRSEWFATQDEAQRFISKTRAVLATDATALPTGPPQYRKADSVAAVAVDWLAHVKKHREAATHAGYADLVKNYLAPVRGHGRYPGLGNVIVNDAYLTPKVIADFLMTQADAGVSLSMRHRLQRGVSAFCTYARFAGKIRGVNPALGLGGKQLRLVTDVEVEREVHPFSEAEMEAILDVLGASEQDHLPYFRFLRDVGVRPGEAAALKWDVVNLDRRRARIELSYSPRAGKDKRPKTYEVRDVDLTTKVIELLLEWRPRQRREALRRGLPQPVYVFTSLHPARGDRRELARLLQDGNVQLVLDRVLEHLGITGHRLYDFRHTFATTHLMQGWDRKLAWVSKQLGHKTPLTTAAFYYAWRDTRATAGFADEIGG